MQESEVETVRAQEQARYEQQLQELTAQVEDLQAQREQEVGKLEAEVQQLQSQRQQDIEKLQAEMEHLQFQQEQNLQDEQTKVSLGVPWKSGAHKHCLACASGQLSLTSVVTHLCVNMPMRGYHIRAICARMMVMPNGASRLERPRLSMSSRSKLFKLRSRACGSMRRCPAS